MFHISDLPKFVHDYKNGEADLAIAYPVLPRLPGDHEVIENMGRLPRELAARFEDSPHEEFGDEDLAKTEPWSGNAGGEPPSRAPIVGLTRHWILQDEKDQESWPRGS